MTMESPKLPSAFSTIVRMAAGIRRYCVRNRAKLLRSFPINICAVCKTQTVMAFESYV